MRFTKGDYPYKYTVSFMDNGKPKYVSFGHQDYEQYKDNTPLKLYKHKDHLDKERRKQYRDRHMKILTFDGTPAYKVKYSPAWFSFYYLW